MATTPTTIRLSGRFKPSDAVLTAQSLPAPFFFDVPAKQRLTIEAFSAECFLPAGQSASVRLLVIDTKTKQAAPPLSYQVALYHQATFNPNAADPGGELRDVWAMNHALRAYIDPGMRLQLDGFRGYFRHSTGGVELVVSGFFEDVP